MQFVLFQFHAVAVEEFMEQCAEHSRKCFDGFLNAKFVNRDDRIREVGRVCGRLALMKLKWFEPRCLCNNTRPGLNRANQRNFGISPYWYTFLAQLSSNFLLFRCSSHNKAQP